MIDAAIVILALATLAGLSLRANRRLASRDRLPMQWSLTGKVNWTAPRPVALAFTPVLGLLGLLFMLWLTLTHTPQHSVGDHATMALLAFGATLIVVHCFHIWLLEKSRP